jgi:hypothetical protein
VIAPRPQAVAIVIDEIAAFAQLRGNEVVKEHRSTHHQREELCVVEHFSCAGDEFADLRVRPRCC